MRAFFCHSSDKRSSEQTSCKVRIQINGIRLMGGSWYKYNDGTQSFIFDLDQSENFTCETGVAIKSARNSTSMEYLSKHIFCAFYGQ
jgi:hypothetical protein